MALGLHRGLATTRERAGNGGARSGVGGGGMGSQPGRGFATRPGSGAGTAAGTAAGGAADAQAKPLPLRSALRALYRRVHPDLFHDSATAKVTYVWWAVMCPGPTKESHHHQGG